MSFHASILRLVDDPERVESLRKMLSSFNHQCRNSLNGIKMSIYLFKREAGGPMPQRWLELERTYQELERLFDRLQVIYRPLSLTLVRSPFGQLVSERLPTWRSWFDLRGRALDVAPPGDDGPSDFDPMYLGLALDAFVAWRAEAGYANFQTSLSWKIEDDTARSHVRGSPAGGSLPGRRNGSARRSRLETIGTDRFAGFASLGADCLGTRRIPGNQQRARFHDEASLPAVSERRAVKLMISRGWQ